MVTVWLSFTASAGEAVRPPGAWGGFLTDFLVQPGHRIGVAAREHKRPDPITSAFWDHVS